MTSNMIPPALIFILGSLLIPFLKGKTKSFYMLLIPAAGFYVLMNIPMGNIWTYEFWGYSLIMGRIDKLSMIFAHIFIIMAFLGVLFALKVDDNLQHVAGIVLYIQKTGTIAFDYIGLSEIESYLIFIGIALNAAAIPLHAWLPDAYPMGTPTSTVFLSAFTTKSSVYLLIRTFPGADLLIWIGAFMVFVPIFYAVLENDIRRVLAYSLLNQIGFMLVGIGIGTQLSLNGATAHAFCHILYKGLLFMAAGSVLQMTGKIKCTEIGGLYKTMPLTCLFCIVGAASTSADKGLNGLNSRSETILMGCVKGVSSFLQNAAVNIVLFAAVNVWLIFGFRGNRLEIKKAKLYNDICHGTLPIGIGAAVSISFILLVFILT